jgi:hypothetical protein
MTQCIRDRGLHKQRYRTSIFLALQVLKVDDSQKKLRQQHKIMNQMCIASFAGMFTTEHASAHVDKMKSFKNDTECAKDRGLHSCNKL